MALQATAIPTSSSTPADTETHGSARLSEALGAKHGYRYEVQFPSTQQKNTVLNRYLSVDKDKDNDSSASLGSTTLAKYTSRYETNMDSPQQTTLAKVYSQPSNPDNTKMPDRHYFNGEYDKRKMEIENDKHNMFRMFSQDNVHPSTKSDEVFPIRKGDMYLPPDTVDGPVPNNESEGYSYEKPSNQFALPNEHKNVQWYPSISNNNDDDSVEVFPPTESPYATWADGNTETKNDKTKAEVQVSTEKHNNYVRQNNQDQRTETFNKYNNDRLEYNSKVSLPTTNTGHGSLLNSPYSFSRNNKVVKSDNSIEVNPQVSTQKNSKVVKSVDSGEFKPAHIASSDLETEIDDLSETSLTVHFAGSVFSADGLPHPSKEMVGKTCIYRFF